MVTPATDRQSGTRVRRASAWLSSTLIAVGLSGCVSAGPSPDQMSRTTLDTAPADLQLLCANEAARSAGVDSTKVLPTSSRKLDQKNYKVELNVGGTPTSCTIDTDGNIRSVQPA
jgi:hypothetical protein